MNCPNLKELFGDRFRVTVEESYYADTGNQKRVDVESPGCLACGWSRMVISES